MITKEEKEFKKPKLYRFWNFLIYGLISDKDIIQFNNSIKSKFINLKKFKDINLIKINQKKYVFKEAKKL